MIRLLELFGGIGACTKALKKLGVEHKVVDYVEIDKYAVKSYNAINGTNFKPQDICKWNKDIEIDLIMHGSPCQDFSIAGKQAGGDKGSETRSSLMYETIRIISKLKPKYVIWENVKNLLSKKHIHNFNNYLDTMDQLGYKSFYQVLNAKDYGIPQNRERVFVVSIKNEIVGAAMRGRYGKDGQIEQQIEISDREIVNTITTVQKDCLVCEKGVTSFEFPQKQELKLRLKDILEDKVDEKYYLSDDIAKKFIASKENKNSNVIGSLHMDKWLESTKRVYDTNSYAPTINTYQGGNLQPKIIDDTYGFDNRQPRIYNNCPTIRAGRQGLKVLENIRIRKLTPKECWRLMGFDDSDFEKAEKVNSNSLVNPKGS